MHDFEVDGTLIMNLRVSFLFVLIGGRSHYFTTLFSFWFSIPTLKNAIVCNRKHPKVAIHSYLFWGSFGEKR